MQKRQFPDEQALDRIDDGSTIPMIIAFSLASWLVVLEACSLLF